MYNRLWFTSRYLCRWQHLCVCIWLSLSRRRGQLFDVCEVWMCVSLTIWAKENLWEVWWGGESSKSKSPSINRSIDIESLFWLFIRGIGSTYLFANGDGQCINSSGCQTPIGKWEATCTLVPYSIWERPQDLICDGYVQVWPMGRCAGYVMRTKNNTSWKDWGSEGV